MIALLMKTPKEISEHLAKKVRDKRLALNFSQKTLSERSGVSFGVIKKFEHTGKISLESLLKIAVPLDAFQELFQPITPQEFNSPEELLKNKTRKRGRK